MSGSLKMVSLGPGQAEHITPAARQAIEQSEVVVGYDLYFTWIKPWLHGKQVITYPLTAEKERALAAIKNAREGKSVVIVSSGDIGVYGMATLVFEELGDEDKFPVCVVPGITAGNACASLLGAPLSHDYVTLSLSDLLCPWDWIEARAKHAAQADLCMALYNVRSQKRPEAIYKIIEIVAQHKGPDTVCGLVRNAYREDQSVKTTTLRELQNHEFDMLTTVIIGNRFTRKKVDWIFTPRGYNQWQSPSGAGASLYTKDEQVPHDAIWVFSGTADGNELAGALCQTGAKVVVSVASEYGAQLARRSCPSAHVVFGRQGVERRRQLLSANKARAIVDATHPYAQAISLQLIGISQGTTLPYIRFERAGHEHAAERSCADIQEALQQALQVGKRIFLASGSKNLAALKDLKIPAGAELFVRITPDAEALERALQAGIPPSNIIAMQGPFSAEFNTTLWRDLRIGAVISKDSGTAGGYDAKVRAAATLNIPLFTVRRPCLDYPRTATGHTEVIDFIKGLPAPCP